MRGFWPIPLLLLAVGFFPPAPSARADSADPAEIEFFEKKIRPLLVERCGACHGAEEQEGGLRLDGPAAITRGGDQGPPVVPSEPDQSLLVEAIAYANQNFQMPPDGKLPQSEIDLLVDWVRRGAAMPAEKDDTSAVAESGFDLEARRGHWAYQSVVRPPVPVEADDAWSQGPIDSFVKAGWRSHGLTPAAAIDRAGLLRRLSFDLVGLPPQPEEIAAFVADAHADAVEREVDRLLASPRYGERWGRHWLDLVRYAETLGHEFDYDLCNAHRYRDYAIRAWNQDLPYDAWIREHLAGDLLSSPRLNPVTNQLEAPIGPSFFWFGEATHSPVDVRQNQADRIDGQIDVLSKTFLAQTVACARCHDHKFDAISQRDYYALAGFLKSSRYDQRDVRDPAETARVVEELESIQREEEHLAGARIAELLRSRIDAAREQWWGDAVERKRLPADHPLRFLEEIVVADIAPSESKSTGSLGSLWEKVSSAWARAKSDPGVTFATFDATDRGRWLASGVWPIATGSRPILRIATVGDRREVHWERPDVVDSAQLSRKTEGTLRSPTFTIEHNFAFVRAAGSGGRINLVVDGFTLIRNPIYGGLSRTLTNPEWQWHRFDLSKWVGHRAYFELVDSTIPNLTMGSVAPSGPPAEDWLRVDEIRFSSSPSPPADPASTPRDKSNGDPDSMPGEEVAKRCGELMSQVVDEWLSRAEPTVDPRVATQVLEFLSRAPEPIDLFAGARPEWRASWDQLQERRQRAESQITRSAGTPTMTDGNGDDEFVFIRGNYRTLADLSPRRFLEVFDGARPLEVSAGSGRGALAERLCDPTNPVVSRVWVNRIWKHHFGEGIVRSPDDFGAMGIPPTHPELLDWLADEFVDGGWTSKRLHRLMVTSAAYRQSSQATDESLQADPRNQWLARMPVQRLEAESIRDAVLAVSGRLNDQMEGPSVPAHLTEYMPVIGRPSVSGPLDGAGRRSVYQEVRRNFLSPLLLAFDYPLPQTTIGRRNVSNVPAQALALLNDPFVVEQSRAWAERLMREESTDEARMNRAFLLAYGRPPGDEERKRGLEFVRGDESSSAEAWAELCHVLFNSKEFLFIP